TLQGAYDQDRELMTRRHLVPALGHYLQARDLCPLRPRPHLRIANYVESLSSADLRSAYLDRAKFLVPADPELWYYCGLQELLDKHEQRAWQNWRRALELSPGHLAEIVDKAS